MRLIISLWAGDVPLVKTFWIYGVFGVAVFIYVPPIIYLAGSLPTIPAFRALSNAHFLISYIYFFFVFVAIWRSAIKYTGSKIWSFMAMIASAMLALSFVSKLLVGFGVCEQGLRQCLSQL
jgi:hypothetical protein